MADEQAQQEQQAQPEADNQGKLDPAFFECTNEHLELAGRLAEQHGVQRVSLASLFAAARLNSHVFLLSVKPIHAGAERKGFLDYMSTMYRRMLNEHLDGLGQERGIDVGESELAAEYAAAGVQFGRVATATPANDYVVAAGAVPPVAPATE